MKILAISGSLRANSLNTSLVRAVAKLAPSHVAVTLYEGLGELPHFSPEWDRAPPLAVQEWRTKVREADAVLICTPEYAYGMPGSLKNALDWLVGSGELLQKPVAALSASPSASGGAQAHALLVLTLTALAAQVVEEAKLIVPFVRTKLDAQGERLDAATGEALRRVVASPRGGEWY